MTTLIITLLIIFLLYAFVGVFSFIPFIFGVFTGLFNFPIGFLSFIYPVGVLPTIVTSALGLYFLGAFIIRLIKH